MSAPVMVIASVGRESTMQRTLSEDDDVIQTLAANGPNEPFHVGPLPRRARRRQYLFDSHCPYLADKLPRRRSDRGRAADSVAHSRTEKRSEVAAPSIPVS